jgi:hypothetical protein
LTPRRRSSHPVQFCCEANSLESTLVDFLVSVENKRLNERISYLESTLTINTGVPLPPGRFARTLAVLNTYI